MSGAWKRRIQVDGDQIVPLKKLVKVGNSHAIILPKDWVVLKAEQDEDGTYWATVKFDGSTFIIGGTR